MGKETLKAVNDLFRENGHQRVQYINEKNQQRILDLYNKTINDKIKDTQLEAAVKELQKLL